MAFLLLLFGILLILLSACGVGAGSPADLFKLGVALCFIAGATGPYVLPWRRGAP